MTKEKKDCSTCNGSGVITKQYIFSEDWPMDCGFHENDCEDCNGSGTEQTEQKGKQMELIVEKKSVYGNHLVYPICNKAKLFASISGNKTLLPEVIESIKKLGYKLTTKQEVL